MTSVQEGGSQEMHQVCGQKIIFCRLRGSKNPIILWTSYMLTFSRVISPERRKIPLILSFSGAVWA